MIANFIKAYTLSFLFLNATIYPIFSQDAKLDSSNNVNGLHKGSWALLFQIDRNFSLRDFQGSTISAKRHFSEKSAVRVGITLNARSRDIQTDRKSTDNFVELTETSDDITTNLVLNIQYLSYLIPNRTINLFLGSGPYVAYRYLKYESEGKNLVSDTLQIIEKQCRKNTEWYIGLSLAFGVEWFAHKSISFLAEYGTVFYYFDRDDILHADKNFSTGELDQTESRRSYHGYEISNQAVKFGISLYF